MGLTIFYNKQKSMKSLGPKPQTSHNEDIIFLTLSRAFLRLRVYHPTLK